MENQDRKENRTVAISEPEQLDVYLNPQRQRIMHEMAVVARPVTCKQLADRLGVSASSITHHMKRLEAIGVVHVDHTEQVRGITARYWTAPPTSVDIRMERKDDFQEEKVALADFLHQRAYDAFRSYALADGPARDRENGVEAGELRTGFVYLTEDEARELKKIIVGFVESREQPCEGTVPWEFSLTCLPHRDADERS